MVRTDPRRGRARRPQLELESRTARRAPLPHRVHRRPPTTPPPPRDAPETPRAETRRTTGRNESVNATAASPLRPDRGRERPATLHRRASSGRTGSLSRPYCDRAHRLAVDRGPSTELVDHFRATAWQHVRHFCWESLPADHLDRAHSRRRALLVSATSWRSAAVGPRE